jgi:hypothetical protein
MASNILDDLVAAMWKTWDDVGFRPSTLAFLVTLIVLIFPFLVLFVFALAQQQTSLPPPNGCRKLGIKGRSNVSDQYANKYAIGSDSSPSNPWTIKALFVYPIKSCAPLELGTADVIRTGLRYDRQFTFAQQVTSLPTLDGAVTSEWVIATQRTFPRLAKVETEIWIPDSTLPDYDPESDWVKSEGCLVVRFPFTPDSDFTLQGMKNYGKMLAARLSGRPEPMKEFRVPFNPPKSRVEEVQYTKEKVKIFKDSPIALNVGNEVPYEKMAELKYTLGVTNPFTLIRIDTENYREVHKCAPKKQDVGFQPVIGMQDSVSVIFHTQLTLLSIAARVTSVS